MSVSVTISGEIIESRNYLSNYFLTLNSDQNISGTKTFNIVNVSSANFSSANFSSANFSAANMSTLNVKQINTSTLDVSTLTFNGVPLNQNQIFGTSDISSTAMNGIIQFGKTFDLVPSVTITQFSSDRIVPICVTNISTTAFIWAASSSNVGKINWSAGN